MSFKILTTFVLALISVSFSHAQDARQSLHFAALDGKIDQAAGALQNGADIDSPLTPEGTPALNLAIQNGHTELASHLIQRGADPFLANNNGDTPLCFAALTNNLTIARLLLKKAPPRSLLKHPCIAPLQIAANLGSLEMMELLIQAGTPINYENHPVLHSAVNAGDFDKINLLLKHGADINQPDSSGNTPFMIAASKNVPRLLQLLKTKGADINAQHTSSNGKPWNALCSAANTDAHLSAIWLMQHGLRPEWENGRPIQVAKAASNQQMIELLTHPLSHPSTTSPTPVTSPPSTLSPAITSPLKIVLAEFTTDDNSYKTAQQAIDFSTLLQAKASDFAGVEWIERSHLQKVQQELELQTSSGSRQTAQSLHLGRWLQAQILITGHFNLNTDTGALLHLEAVDLTSADVLSRRVLSIDIPVESRFAFTEQHLHLATDLLREALAEALRHRQQNHNKVRIAPLFFRNLSPHSQRLDFLEQDILAALNNTGASPTHHFLQFPRSESASSEAELAISGLVEADPDAWKRLAHYYVWGEYEEIDPPHTPFPEMSVRLRLHLWDGARAPRLMEFTFKPATLPTQLPVFVQQIVSALPPAASTVPNDTARDSVAGALHQRAQELQSQDQDFQEGLKRTPRWLNRWKLTTQLLQLAHFLSPSHQNIQRDLLVEKWNELAVFPRSSTINARSARYFWKRWQQTDQWRQHIERFGFALLNQLPNDSMTPAKIPDRSLTYSSSGRPVRQNTSLYLSRQMLTMLQAHHRSFPDELPYSVYREWNQRHLRDLADSLILIATKTPDQCTYRVLDLAPLLDQIDDSKLRISAYQSIATIASKQSEIPPADMTRFQTQISLAHARVGIPLSPPSPSTQTSLQPAPGSPSPPWSRPSLPTTSPPSSLLEEKQLNLPLTPIHLDPDTDQDRQIAALHYSNNQLIISTTEGVTPEIWLLQLPNSKPTRVNVLAAPPRHHFTAIASSGQKLWLSSNGAGAWTFDPATKSHQTFATRDGLSSENLLSCASANDLIYFGSGDPTRQGKGAISVFNLHTRQWHGLTRDTPFGSIHQLQATPQHLLVSEILPSGAPSHHLYRFASKSWALIPEPPDALLKPPASSRVTYQDVPKAVCAADKNGFWIAGGGSVFFHDSNTFESTPLFTQQSPLEGVATSIHHDETYLWIATVQVELIRPDPAKASRIFIRSTLHVINKQTRQRLGHFPLPGSAFVSSLASSPTHLWIGMHNTSGDAPILFEIPKSSFP